jgi:uncharacterized membrane protein
MFVSTLMIVFHILAAVVWVGGMFFAHVALRPSIGALEPPQRLKLMHDVLGRFFTWVWVAVIVLPTSGYILIFAIYGNLSTSPVHVHVMQAVGWLMIALFFGLFAVPYQRFTAAIAAQDWPSAGSHLAPIRHIVAINLLLGLITAAIGASGRFWG